MVAHGYALDHVRHCFMSLDGSFAARLAEGERQVAAWAEEMAGEERGEHDLSHLKIALQCGGSDSFSGISGNPLAAWVARELIRYGGAANLAEDRRVDRCRTIRAAKRQGCGDCAHLFAHGRALQGAGVVARCLSRGQSLRRQQISRSVQYRAQVHWRGRASATQTCVWTTPLTTASRSKRLVSTLWTVRATTWKASPDRWPGGCNAIFFVTGNGSITNFPFVPTVKIVTTSERYQLLAADLDVNAGAYLDGTPMDELGQELFERHLAGGLGRALAGRAGRPRPSVHLAQLATDRYQPVGGTLGRSCTRGPARGGCGPKSARRLSFPMLDGAIDQVGLVLPHQPVRWPDRPHVRQSGSMSGKWAASRACPRFVALVHTEGCGLSSSGATEQMHLRTMMGVRQRIRWRGAFCFWSTAAKRRTNDYMRNGLEEWGLDPAVFGWASVQLGRRHCQGHGQGRGVVPPSAGRKGSACRRGRWLGCLAFGDAGDR